MEPATIAVLAITAAFLGFCIWIERHSRSQERAPQSSESVDDRPEVAEDSGGDGNGGGAHERNKEDVTRHKSTLPPLKVRKSSAEQRVFCVGSRRGIVLTDRQ